MYKIEWYFISTTVEAFAKKGC